MRRGERLRARGTASRVSTAAVALAIATMATTAFGQENATTAARRVLLDQAQRARDGGDHARALQYAMQAGAIQMTGSLRMFLAEEHRALGQLADALGAADACVRESERDASLPNRDAIIRRCRAIVDELRARVSLLTIAAPDPPAGLRVLVAGVEVPPRQFGIPRAVTPGSVQIEATAPGRASFRQTVALREGQLERVEIRMGADGASGTRTSAGASSMGGSSAAGSGAGSAPGAAGRDSSAGAPAARTTSAPSIVGPIVLMASGGAAVAASFVFLALRGGALGSCTVQPGFIDCPTEADRTRATGAYGFDWAFHLSLPTGAAMVGGGLIWLLVTPRGSSLPRAERLGRVVPFIAGATHVGIAGEF